MPIPPRFRSYAPRLDLFPAALLLPLLIAVALLTAGCASQPAPPPVTWAGRTLAILRDDAALPVSLTVNFPAPVDQRANALGLRGAVLSRADLPAARVVDLLLSRPAFLALAADPASRVTLVDFIRAGNTLMVLETPADELAAALGVEVEPARVPAEFHPQIASTAWTAAGWSAGAILQPIDAPQPGPDDILTSALSAIAAWQDPAPSFREQCDRVVDHGWVQFKHCPEYNYRERNVVCELPRFAGQPDLGYRVWRLAGTTIGPASPDGCASGFSAQQLDSSAAIPEARAYISDWSPKNGMPASGTYFVNFDPHFGDFGWSWDGEGVALRDRSNPSDGVVAWRWEYPSILGFSQSPAATGAFTIQPGFIETVRCRAPGYPVERTIDYTTTRNLFQRSAARFTYTLPGRGQVCDTPPR